jgi:multidrug efflux system outer membrane protein
VANSTATEVHRKFCLTVTGVALVPAQMQAENLRVDLTRLQANQEAAHYRLAALLGKTPSELQKSEFTCTTEPQLVQPLPIGDGAALIKRRPDIRQAERQLAAATEDIGVAIADLYPSIAIGTSLGYSGTLSHLGEQRTKYWSLGPLISWKIPDNSARARVKTTKAEAAAALAKFDGTVLNALRETEIALTYYTHSLQRNAALRLIREKSAQLTQDKQRLYKAGRIDYLSSLDAEQALVDSDKALAISNAQVTQDQVTLFLALGGGWQQTYP